MTDARRPITMLIAALGGEGGGVLTDWVVATAQAQGFPVQSTSIPGVAQRTGATTYYIEILPIPCGELNGRHPVLALTPGIADVDVIVASELMEAGRAVTGGFATPERTTLIASTHRSYAIAEKIVMGDGRYDEARLKQAIAASSRERILFDMSAAAGTAGAMINAVMLGAIAASGRLPIRREAFEAAIRADGKAVKANLRGFGAGFSAAQARAPDSAEAPAPRRAAPDARIVERVDALPERARDLAREGVRRLTAYQDEAYARLYLDRLVAIADADTRAQAGGRLAASVARHLAVRMSYEDVIRVAQAKIEPERFARIAKEVRAGAEDPVRVFDFLKPGVEEACQILPPTLARRVLAFCERRGLLGRLYWGMEVETTSVTGYLRFWLLAKLKFWRPKSFRYVQEQASIEEWLALVLDAARISSGLAIEISECARLIKGYGDTWHRGMRNYRTIEARLIRPSLIRLNLADGIVPQSAAGAVANARAAALVDPEGESLDKCLAEIERLTALPLAAAKPAGTYA